MPGKERSNLLVTLMLVIIAAGQAINVTAWNNDVNTTTTVLDKTSINITDFSVVVDGSVVDFFLP